LLVVDDSEVVRLKLRRLVEAERGMELAGEAPDGEAGVRLASQLRPDVVVMDLKMPGISGIEATWRLGTAAPGSRVLVLTVSDELDDAAGAILAGAHGYVIKGADDDELVAAILGVAAGESVVSPAVANALIERVGAAPKPPRRSGPLPGRY
jgi:DNA-binding NarL/FixJ family response regulator